jgi:2-dehydro-3-deoxyphosphogluconate aldolase/(4S)-4-hydroxy-2-oxoglutarate aldolase
MLSKDERVDLVILLSRHRLIPVATFPDVTSALKVAELLSQNSICVIEITMRNRAALECVAAVRREFPAMTVGAGSVLGIESLKNAAGAGAMFCVAPCFDREVTDAAAAEGIDFMPGIATPTELSAALRAGAKVLKVFPAAALGGPDYIGSLVRPFGMMDFSLVPTGGITEKNYAAYMASPRVIACGSSGVVDAALVVEKNYAGLASRIRSFAALCGAVDRGPSSSPS